jgi:CRP/FNR family transcriptional regulator, cyclic AMP receptor protein
MKETKRHKYRNMLESIPFFACFAEEDLSKVEEIIRETCFKKNNVILFEDETKNYMYIVFSGKIKVVQVREDGKEQIFAIHKKGDFFGEMALLDGKTQPANVVAMEDATVGLIAKNDFENYFLKNDTVLKQIIFLLCKRLRESWLMLRVLSFADAEQRVMAVLTHLSSIYGVKDLRGVIIPFKLTHKEIANYTALARETVSRLLSRLSQSGDIEILENKNIVLKPSFIKKSLYL